MSRLLLVRHGQSEWNAAGRWQGHADSPLTDRGRAQARLAADALGAVAVVASSDLARAAQTAVILAEALGIGPVVLDAALRERYVGEWQGLTRAEIHERWPGYLRDDPSHGDDRPGTDRHLPSWEPDDAIIERSRGALRRVAELAGGDDAVAVTHGGVIAAWERHLGGTGAGPLTNLTGRWLVVEPQTGEETRVALGERIRLVPSGAATASRTP